MQLQPYKQTLTHSCLSVSFLMILQLKNNIHFTKKDEEQITLRGSDRVYPFYVTGIATEIAKKYKVKIQILANNKFFTNVLKESFKNKNIIVSHEKITIALIRKLLDKNKLICHIDIHGLGDFSHSSHFIVIEKEDGKTFTIIDPWTGQRRKIAEKTLEKAITELRDNVKMCPLLFFIY